ncbi:YceI family protein [Ulvibacter antarcticus]|uniref:Polyisoprenoid-binding protein YceI n=1 Tax=Ulvibacter antarcticus TaxID=442714 RepID=A0A3L9YIC3_9FLAO|nr:YceI family protein [Ulvibacter antarcticus]RMA57905.1 polyisoprenoid-binding protein YceI [Ulvibacter antarcticus]
MKKSILKISLIAFISLGVVSCKDSKDKTNEATIEAAEASNTATDYTVNTTNSVISWEGNKPTGSHVGNIRLSAGSISINKNEIEAGNFTIDMNSIVDKDLEGEDKANLEAHLKGTVAGKEGDFFDVNTYPTATFEITNSTTSAPGKTTIKGNLTIKDKTNPIEFPATITLTEGKLLIKSETFSIDRTKWGVNYGSKSIFDNLGDKFISDEMKLTVELHATK